MTSQMHTLTKTLAGVALLAMLVACGSGLSSSSSSGSKSSGATTGTSLVELGNGVGTTFANGVLKIQVTKLSAGGTTGVTANIVDANNSSAFYTQSVTVNFTSNCVSAGTATIDASVTTLTGTASATYTAAGCTGTDTITATATVGSTVLTATGSLTVQSATLGSLIFVTAAPTEIGLAGMGGVTSSKVTFKLLDTNGNAVPDITMSFATDTTVGGITVLPATAQTQSDGTASTFIQAGTEHTVVHVTATATSNKVTKTGGSTGVTISTGIPTETSFTLVVNPHNVEGADVFLGGVKSQVTVALNDRFQNPVLDGTQVSFTTNGGGIDSKCITALIGGTSQCTATWIAKTPVPDPTKTNVLDTLDHAHILAYTIGEEHFTDKNNDGIFDNGDTFIPFSANVNAIDNFLGVDTPPQDDIGDPYMDTNENGAYDINEPFESPISTTTRRAPNGSWYGANCGGVNSGTANVTAKDENGTPQTVPCGGTKVIVGKEECIVMGTSSYVVMDPTVVNASVGNTASPTTVSIGTGVSVTYYILDSNGDVPASGTVITLTTTGLVSATAAFPGSTSTVTVPDLPDACLTGSKGAIPSSGNSLPFKGYPVTVILNPVTGSATPVSGNFSFSMKTFQTAQNEVGITVPVSP